MSIEELYEILLQFQYNLENFCWIILGKDARRTVSSFVQIPLSHCQIKL